MMATHLFSYRWQGHTYAMEVEADNEADARNRHYAMAHATYDGQLVGRIPAIPGAGIGVRVITYFRNMIKDPN